MDKSEIVRCLKLANDLWAIEGANPYSVRAHTISADAIASAPYTVEQILRMPPGTIYGVGRETLAMVAALQSGGMPALLERLQISIPVEASELLRLPGIGPKTAHELVHSCQIGSVQELQEALLHGQLDNVPGLGPKKLARLRRDIRVFLEQKMSIPVARAWPLATQLAEIVRAIPGVDRVAISGPLRRLVVVVPRIELVISTSAPDDFTKWLSNWTSREAGSATPATPEVLGASTGSGSNISVYDAPIDISLEVGGNRVAVRWHVVQPAGFATRLMETTGDETHQGVIEGLLAQKDIEWTPKGLIVSSDVSSLASSGASSGTSFDASSGVPSVASSNSQPPDKPSSEHRPVAIVVRDEADIYARVGLPYFPPEVCEGQGLLCQPNELVDIGDIRGDLHVHTTWSDGSLSTKQVVAAAEAIGYEYVAITDHSQSLTIANGLTPERLMAQQHEIHQVRQNAKIHILHGTEVDILSDGSLDFPDGVLAQLDIVIASVHSAMHQTRDEMTERILRAIRHPAVHIIGHLTGRILGRRSGYELDIPRIIEAAAESGVMLEINANPNRLDIDDSVLRLAKDAGILIPINTDTHHPQEFDNMDYGVKMARRGLLYKADVLNTLPYPPLVKRLTQKRQGW